MKITNEQRAAIKENLVESWKNIWLTPYDACRVGLLPKYADAMVDKIEEILNNEQAE